MKFENLIDVLNEYRSKGNFFNDYNKLRDEYEKIWQECVFLMRLVNDKRIAEYVSDAYKSQYLCEYDFLCDYQYVYSQLQILFHEYSNSPAGLSSKQICRTLMRFGFPPVGKIAERINAMKIELDVENKESVDSKCSLCTGTVLSCLVLADESEEIMRPVKKWLKAQKGNRYSHLQKNAYSSDAGDTEHALHYASQVLQAFIDCGDIAAVDEILRCFFSSDSIAKDGFYHEWMLYRNISNAETCAYILSSFLRYVLSENNKFHFSPQRQQFIKRAITNLVFTLDQDTAPLSKPWRLYATRENIQSLCLGLLVGERQATIGWLKELMKNIHFKAIRVRNAKGKSDIPERHKYLMDSNVDRAMRFIEGWVSYWETILYLKDGAPHKDVDGNKLRRTINELKDDGYLPNY